MSDIYAESPEQAYKDFREELARLLNKTITQAPLSHVESPVGWFIEFRRGGSPIHVSVGRGLYLFVGQVVQAVAEQPQRFRIRTLKYEYRIAEGESRDAPYLIRWEYVSREQRESLSPRHHIHLPIRHRPTLFPEELDFDSLHVPSGWVTLEEVIRFLIQELRVTPHCDDWDQVLRESEERFRQRTARGGSAS